MGIHYVTYVTHKDGIFDKLINNDYNLNIDVIGWGQKWNGLMDKMVGYNKYCRQFPDNDLVVFLDGFDTIVNKDPSQVTAIFNALECEILVSHDVGPNFIFNYAITRVFGKCKNGNTANSGMIMGRVRSLKPMFEKIIATKAKCDQIGFNMWCRNNNIEHLKIDTDRVIFENYRPNKEPRGIFLSYPGGGPALPMGTRIRRWLRAIFFEYGHLFIVEIVLLIIILRYLGKKYIWYN